MCVCVFIFYSIFRDIHSTSSGLPSYEQSVSPHIGKIISRMNYEQWMLLEIPPPYDEAIKIKSTNPSNDQQQSTPIHSISLSIDQASPTIFNRK